MSCLLLRLAAPLQSWGYRSRFSDRDTGREPTKSGVIGLLCCALGRNRTESPADLAAMPMHVRVDHEGAFLKDFHTAGGGVFRGERNYFAPVSSGGKGKNTVVTERHYLQDASFLVAFEGDDAILAALSDAVADPVWPLALGRRSCPPSAPILVGIREAAAEVALRQEPFVLPSLNFPKKWKEDEGRYGPDLTEQRLRLVLECERGDTSGEMRRDVPVAWEDRLNRKYTVRFVRETLIPKTPEVLP